MKLESDPKIGRLFTEGLLDWNARENHRKMPWKGEKDPYKIWLSEIILQQTRVEQGLKYYENFISAFPTVHALAGAPEEQVYKLWEGLGYYSRCRNLLEAGKFISRERKGVFPTDYASILQLKGVGSYTAAAIASFAYNLPHAVLDGNVFRVLSRIFDEETPVDSTSGKKRFSGMAQDLLPDGRAAEYNQAIMDFGAQVCKPVPECKACFFNSHCKAYLAGKQQSLPVKEKKVRIRQRWMHYIVARCENEVAVRQRTGRDIWPQLFEFILIENSRPCSPKEVLQQFESQFEIDRYQFIAHSEEKKQKLSHQLICFRFIVIELQGKQKIGNFQWVSVADLQGLAFPKTLKEFIHHHLQ